MRSVLAALVAALLLAAPVGARVVPLASEAEPRACGGPDPVAGYRAKGKALVGDVDAEGKPDRVTLRVDTNRPPRCRHLLVVETAAGPMVVAAVKPLPWPGTDPRLRLLAEIDGRGGLEPVVSLTSSAAVYRPGAVFTMRDGRLARMRLEGANPAGLFPFYDEFPSGVDCTGRRGRIVATFGALARNDSYFDLRRSLYQAAGTRFELVRTRRIRVAVGPEAKRRWPELRGDPFLSCPRRVVR
jgi:hypothetical protein